MHATYEAAVLSAPAEIHLEEIHYRPVGDGEVGLEVQYAGICGTDLSLYRGHYPVPFPLIMGHEFSARVIECGVGVANCWMGKRVVCEINNSCVAYGRTDLCVACARGLSTHCLKRSVTGIINHPGAFAQRMIVPAGNLHGLPTEISDRAAVFIEPLAAAIRTFEITPIHINDVVLVLGCGRLGRLIALVANRMGARVIAVARTAKSLDMVRGYSWKTIAIERDVDGPASVVENNDRFVSIVRELTEGLGADVVVEATGINESAALALRLVRPLGTVALKSTSGVPAREIDTTAAIVNEITIATSRCGPFDKAVEFMKTHGLPDESWISAEFQLHQIREAFQAAEQQPKVILNLKQSMQSG